MDFSFDFFTAWSWLSIGMALILIEMLAPGLIVVWFGASALVMALIVGFFPGMGWAIQLGIFSLMSLASLVVGRAYLKRNPVGSDEQSLNRRADQYVGLTFTLVEAIVDGHGKVKVDDSIWKVVGPDLPEGTRVRVTGTSATVLEVEEA